MGAVTPTRVIGGRYVVLAELGRGGMGIVWRAEDRMMGRHVAVKELHLPDGLGPDDRRLFRERLLREARTAGRLNDPAIVTVYDVVSDGGVDHIVMELIEAPTLADVVARSGPLSENATLEVARRLLGALRTAHERGVVHRDVKPSNVMIDEAGSANLTDFGLAKGRAYTVLTKPGMVMGTLDYVAPELLRGSEAAAASDIYALGCLAYECTAGRAPFADTSMFDLASAHLNVEPPDPCVNRPDAPEGLSWAILQALAKDPESRPPTATAYAHLISFAAGSHAPSPSPPAPSPPP
jgi:eukaryotic-like serine/threonine-protein kinase